MIRTVFQGQNPLLLLTTGFLFLFYYVMRSMKTDTARSAPACHSAMFERLTISTVDTPEFTSSFKGHYE
ncbi:MAG TPA: hypothetical protein DCY03_04980 [Planctomycetaceae bacterium]|nr:hypothetical protein [Planctomycetaceae bacterium]